MKERHISGRSDFLISLRQRKGLSQGWAAGLPRTWCCTKYCCTSEEYFLFHHVVTSSTLLNSRWYPYENRPNHALSLRCQTVAGSRAGQVGEWSDQWKVLVYDKPCRNIISTLLHVTQLRKQGVTLHMLVNTHGH